MGPLEQYIIFRRTVEPCETWQVRAPSLRDAMLQYALREYEAELCVDGSLAVEDGHGGKTTYEHPLAFLDAVEKTWDGFPGWNGWEIRQLQSAHWEASFAEVFCSESPSDVKRYAGAASLALAVLSAKPSRKQKAIIKLLVNADDTNAIAPLIEALKIGTSDDVEIRKLVSSGLVHLLPRLRASDAHLLNDKQRALVRGALSGDDKPLTLAILKAFERIGDARDLYAVEKICSVDREIMEAAKACLPFLLARAE